MAILNGFLRGVYDKEITSNVDNKQYSGVATEMKNFVGTKRGALSRRAPFKFIRELKDSAWIIPFVYDADAQYLISFWQDEDNEKARYQLLMYNGYSLTVGTAGDIPQVIQPVFTSNEQDEFITAQSSTIQGVPAYNRFNSSTAFHRNGMVGYWVSIKYPVPVKLYELNICNYHEEWVVLVMGYTPYLVTVLFNFVVEASNDGESWTQIKAITSTRNGNYTHQTFDPDEAYLYYRVRIVSLSANESITNYGNFGAIKLKVLTESGVEITYNSPYDIEQVRDLHWVNENKRIVFFHSDVQPYEILQTIQQLRQTGLNFDEVGYPTFGCFYQERLCMGGYTKANRQFNMSRSNPKDDVEFNFTLPTGEIKGTDAMQFVIRNAKYPLRESLAGRNVIYLQCVDGLATVSSGGDEVPLTPTQISANLRNHTSFSDIPAVYQEELAFLVGADKRTVYGMDYDYNVMRVRTTAINEHCITYFDAGIAQMITLKGQLPYIVFRLEDGQILVATAYRTTTGFNFHLFPLEIGDGKARCIASLFNPVTGYDTLFAIIEHSNGVVALESLESSQAVYTEEKGRAYFVENIMLDHSQKIEADTKIMLIRYEGTVSSTGKRLFVGTDIESVLHLDLPNKEIKLFWGQNSVICKNCEFDDRGMWAETDIEPPVDGWISGYQIPQTDWALDEYRYLNVKVFDGDDVVDCQNAVSREALYAWGKDNDVIYTYNQAPEPGDKIYDENGVIKQNYAVVGYSEEQQTVSFATSTSPIAPTYTYNRDILKDIPQQIIIQTAKPIYGGTIGVPYVARAEFENLVGVEAVPYEKEIDNISACMTYGTGVKLGTESALESIGFSNYKYKDWQDRILPDESLKNIPLQDTARKDKKIVLECDYPFPANITFIVYDLKITGVK